MEATQPVVGQQKKPSFNPNAATFTPSQISGSPKDKEQEAPRSHTPITNPHELLTRSGNTKRGGSPMAPARNTAPADLEALCKMILDNHTAMNQNMSTIAPRQDHLFAPNITTTRSIAQAQPFKLLQRPSQPNSSIGGPDEISATLGLSMALPGSGARATIDESPVRSNGSHLIYGLSEPLPGLGARAAIGESSIRSNGSHLSRGLSNIHGKLIDRALEKPLTPSELAQFLSSGKSISSDGTTSGSEDFQGTVEGFATPALHGQGEPNTKIVRPPPGFAGEVPRKIEVETHVPVATKAGESTHVPTGPAALQATQHGSLYEPSPYKPSNRWKYSSDWRRPLASPRTKRMDQGPEPSEADIYPDDAKWQPHEPFRFGNHAMPTQGLLVPPSPSTPEYEVYNTISRTTPGKMYTNVSFHPRVRNPAPFNIFDGYYPPTAEDIKAPDTEAMLILSQLPDVSLDVLVEFRAYDLLGRQWVTAKDPVYPQTILELVATVWQPLGKQPGGQDNDGWRGYYEPLDKKPGGSQ